MSSIPTCVCIYQDQVVKAINATYFPDVPPLHTPPFLGPRPSATEMKNRVFLTNSFFYLAYLPTNLFSHNEVMTKCFQMPTMEHIPVERNEKGIYSLRSDVLQKWRTFDKLLKKSIATINLLVFKGQHPDAIIVVDPVDYGYTNTAGHSQLMKKLAWDSRTAFAGAMAYLSVLLAYLTYNNEITGRADQPPCDWKTQIGRAHV